MGTIASAGITAQYEPSASGEARYISIAPRYIGCRFQALFAGIVPGPFGNQQLVLTGDTEDALSGRAGMHLGIDRLGSGDPAGLDWTSASDMPDVPGIRASWYFTATRELGAGNHRFFGQAQDAAGNVEALYEIATVLWPPTASPDIAGSLARRLPELRRSTCWH